MLGTAGDGHLGAQGPCWQKHRCQPAFMALPGEIALERGLTFQIWMLTGRVRQHLGAQVILKWSVRGSKQDQSSAVGTHRRAFAPRGLLIRQGWQKSRKSGLGLWRNLLEATPNQCQSREWHPGLQLPPQALDNQTTSNGFPKVQPNQTTDLGSTRISVCLKRTKKMVKVKSILSLRSFPNLSAKEIHQQSRAQKKGAWAQAGSTLPRSRRCLRHLWRLTAPTALLPHETFCTNPMPLQPTFPHPRPSAGQASCLPWQLLEPGARVAADGAGEAAEGQHC